MSERGSSVEERLRRLGAEVELPPAPELASTVRSRLEHEQLDPVAGRRPRARRSLAVAVAILLVGGSAAYAASSEFREAVRELLGIGAVEIERAPELPAVVAGAELGLGEPVTATAAAERVGFRLLESNEPLLAAPDGVFARPLQAGAAISFAYRARPGLPALPGAPGIGLLLTQLDSEADPGIVKTVLAEARIEQVRIGGSAGYWLGGRDHVVGFPGSGSATGVEAGEPLRASANTLLWERGGVTLRLEAEISQPRAVRLARTLR